MPNAEKETSTKKSGKIVLLTPEEAVDAASHRDQDDLSATGRKTLKSLAKAVEFSMGKAFSFSIDRDGPGSPGYELTDVDILVIEGQAKQSRWDVKITGASSPGDGYGSGSWWVIKVKPIPQEATE